MEFSHKQILGQGTPYLGNPSIPKTKKKLLTAEIRVFQTPEKPL